MFFFPIALIVLLVFINRYFLGMFFRRVRGSNWDRTVAGYEPTVTVVIPMYNEGRTIVDTIESLMHQEYPTEKLSVTVVDDCSKDDSYEWAMRAAESWPDRVRVIRNPYNMGKRRGINHAVRVATSELIVSVDSDTVVDLDAVRKLVARFAEPEIAAVGGRVNVSNANQNWLTRMQTIKYHFGYEYLKNIERAFGTVMCLSGCLTAYRRSVLVELEPILESREILGVPIKYGEDRFLTNQIVKAGYRTCSTLDAVCWTKAPDTVAKYFSQQLRWRRSNIVDFLVGATHIWKRHPLVTLHYVSMFAMLMSYPVVVAANLMNGMFFELAIFHFGLLAFLGTMYHFDVRHLPAHLRVHPLWFLSLGVIMPVTYVLYTPLALFTLDSSSWETRGHTPGARPDVVTADTALARSSTP
jgi:cellulose synthase/poly-beta-1,6-N-acetylglucosamine synthase-like glycosyltransferase